MSKILNKDPNSTKHNKNISIEKKNTLGKNNNNKKVIYKKEKDSEPEIEESQYLPEEDDDIEEKKKRWSNLPKKEKRREISDKVFLGNTVSPFDDAGRSSAIHRTAPNYNNAQEKVKKVRELINTGRYDENIAKYFPGLLELKFHGALEDIDTREKFAHLS